MKVAASAALVFHLLAVLIFPNPNSIIFREMPFLSFYGNLLGLNTTWRFFSPNPLIRTVEYTVYSYDESAETFEASKVWQYPESVEAVGNRETFNRLLNFAMLAANTAEWANALLGPILCRKHVSADVIALYQVKTEFLPIEKARMMQASGESLYTRHKEQVADIHCENHREMSPEGFR